MTEVDRLRSELDAALEQLLAAFEGIPQAEFERERPEGAIRDLLWRVGLREDWVRRGVSHVARGEAAPAFLERARPAIAEAPEYLAAWLDQCHRPMLALLRRLPEDVLSLEVLLAEGETRSVGSLLASLASEMRVAAEAIQALRAEPSQAGARGTEGIAR